MTCRIYVGCILMGIIARGGHCGSEICQSPEDIYSIVPLHKVVRLAMCVEAEKRVVGTRGYGEGIEATV